MKNERVVDKGYADFVKLTTKHTQIDALLVNSLVRLGIQYSVSQVLYVNNSEDICFGPNDLNSYVILESRFYLVERTGLKQNQISQNKQQTTGLKLTIVR